MAFSNTILPSVAPVEAGGPALSALKNAYNTQQAGQNAFLTNQQAQWLPYQYKMQAISSPVLWQAAATNPTLQNQLIKMMNSPIPGAVGGMSTSYGLLDRLLGKIGLGPAANAMNQSASGASPSNNAMYQGQSNSLQQPSNNAMIMPGNVSQPVQTGSAQPITTGGASIPTSTVNRAAIGSPLSGNNPMALANAQTAGLNTTATAEASAQQDQWKDIQNEARDSSAAAVSNLNYLDKLRNTYPKLGYLESGPGFGSLPAVTTAAQDVDTAQTALGDSVARAQQTGHITGKDRDTYNGIKPGRYMTKDAFDHALDFNEGMNKRVLEIPAFNATVNTMQLTPAQRDAVWNYYIRSRPFYDAKQNKINEDNLGSWEDFLTPDKIKEAMSPKQQKLFAQDKASQAQYDEKNGTINGAWPTNKLPLNAKELEGQMPPSMSVWMVRPDGQQVPVHNSNINHAKQLGYRGINP